MNNKRITEIIKYYEKLTTDTEIYNKEETKRIEQSKRKYTQNNSNEHYDNWTEENEDFEENNMNEQSDEWDDPKDDSFNPHQELNNLHNPQHVFISGYNTSTVYYCTKCKIVYYNETQFNDHIFNHGHNNNACYCRTCNQIFNNDLEYYNHVNSCKGSNNTEQTTDHVPTDPNGSFECPICHKRYINEFYMGEHFINAHNDYNIFCELDHVEHNGFPGFEILKKIEMIEDANNKEKYMCDICCFNFEDNIFTNDNEINEDDRSALMMTCCQLLICRDCLMHHIIESDTIICPYCRKDHTRNDLEYITFIEPSDTTERDRWILWWEDHIDIFSYKN